MKQVTNEVYRTKRKLKLLEEDGIMQLMRDAIFEIDSSLEDIIAILIIKTLKNKYLQILEDYKPNEQIKMDL